MLSPVFLIFIVFAIKKTDFTRLGSYTWENFNSQLSLFFVFLVGPIITSFISVFSVFYEYQQKKMKDILASPHDRIKIILVKIIYVSAFVLLQYALAALVNVLCAFILGLGITMSAFLTYSGALLLAGLSTIVLVPLMIFVTLLTRGFIPALVLTVIGTISNVLALNWEKSYLSPWAIPADLSMIMRENMPMQVAYPAIGAVVYFLLFMTVTLVYFKQADQSV